MDRRIVYLDRDGVLNAMVVDAEHGTVDSPLHPDQVRLIEGVPAALGALARLGYALVVVTNQPAAAKGKTTRANLDAVHARVLALAETGGARIARSQICFHRAEDGCGCRKPLPGMLHEAHGALGGGPPIRSWMVGDGITDVACGAAFGARTALLGPRRCDACAALDAAGPRPDAWLPDLGAFARLLEQEGP